MNRPGSLRLSDFFSLLPEPSFRPFVIAIDGIGTSGKTTLAAEISRRLAAEVVHMDDYFLPFEERTQTRMNEAMGNIEWERLRRIEKRDPEWKRRTWRDEWIPLEDTYFAVQRPDGSADFIIDCMEY